MAETSADRIRRMTDEELEKVEEDLNFFRELEEVGITKAVILNYKTFEDECIRDGVTLKQILTLKDIVRGMTCETCRDKKTCAIYDNFNIRYCSDWNRGGVDHG